MILCVLLFGAAGGVFGQIYTTIDPRHKTRKADGRNNIPVIVAISSNNDIFLNSEKTAKDEITEKINRLMDAKEIYDEIVYIKADFNANYGSVVEIMKLGRAAMVDDYGIIVGTAETGDASVSGALNIKIPLETDSEEDSKPYPYALIVAPGKDGKITLNKKTFTPEALAAKLQQTFLERKQKRIYRLGSREVEKTVFIVAPLSAKYGDVVNIIKIVKSTGAFPIGLGIDDLPK
jgi:biopolymer transport protein ExbD